MEPFESKAIITRLDVLRVQGDFTHNNSSMPEGLADLKNLNI